MSAWARVVYFLDDVSGANCWRYRGDRPFGEYTSEWMSRHYAHACARQFEDKGYGTNAVVEYKHNPVDSRRPIPEVWL